MHDLKPKGMFRPGFTTTIRDLDELIQETMPVASQVAASVLIRMVKSDPDLGNRIYDYLLHQAEHVQGDVECEVMPAKVWISFEQGYYAGNRRVQETLDKKIAGMVESGGAA